MWGAACFTLIVTCFTVRWAFEPVDKGVQRMPVSLYVLLLLVLMGTAYLFGWLVLRARGIRVAEVRGKAS